MTNLDCLKLELANKEYFCDEKYAMFMKERGLDSSEQYNKSEDESSLIKTIITILQELNNNIDLYLEVEDEFTTAISAYIKLNSLIDEFYNRLCTLSKNQARPDYYLSAS